jgi:dipeptidyl aminopeptidase/acylaminoacyl peptidase
MRRIMLAAAALAVAIGVQAQTHPMTFDDLASMRRIGAPQVSPDGKWIAYDASDINVERNKRLSSVYLVSAAGGTSKRLGDGLKQDEGPSWSPDGKKLAFVSDRDGEPKQIYLYDVATTAVTKVSSLQGGAGSVKWVPDGSGLVAVSDIYPDCGVETKCADDVAAGDARKPSKARVIDSLLFRHWKAWTESTRSHIVYVPLAAGAAPRDLTPGTFDSPPFSVGGGDEFDVSPDGKELVYSSNTDKNLELSTNADLFIVPVAGGDSKRITTRTGADTSPHYSPDGKWIAYRSQARAGYESDLWELTLYNRATGQITRIATDFPNGVDTLAWAPDSRSILFIANESSKEPLYEVNLSTKAITKLWGDHAASALTISPNGGTVYFQASSLIRPADIYSIPRKGGFASQLTHENDALLASIEMGATSDTWWNGAADARVQGLLVKPAGFDASKKYPAVVLIHGGPQGAWNDAWSYRWNPQMFAAAGYAILMPNPRGSTGYGQKFVEEISGDWGGKAYTDIMNGVDQFSTLPYVDPSHMGAAGASYGGYMIDWILGHSDRFKALVSHDGVYNLPAMYGTTEELWFPEWEFGGNPWDNPELYQKWSPSNYVKNFKTPTLVVHGELDFRVPVGQGFELFTALQRRGVPSRLLYFPDEGHWVLKPQNSKLWYQTVTGWLDQWLKK